MKIAAYCGPNDVWYEPGDNGQILWKGQGVWATLDILRHLLSLTSMKKASMLFDKIIII